MTPTQVRSNQLGAHLSVKPEIPILYLTNIFELEGPQAYVAMAVAGEAPVVPALWQVRRDVHVNLNAAEQRAAFLALVDWVAAGEIMLEKGATV